jgi:colanic acid biosynthesis glycosyl transferase WcaI
MRILILTQFFAPEPLFKPLSLARKLLQMGHSVEVLTGFPNYPLEQLYPGYRTRVAQRETVDGVPVTRVPVRPSHGSSSSQRILSYLSIAFSAAIIGPFVTKPADVIFVYGHPSMCIPAMWLSALRRMPYVYDIQDIWPDTVVASGINCNPRLLKLIDRCCRVGYRRAARLTAISPGFKSALMRRGVDGTQIDVIYNWCDEAQLVFPPRDAVLSDELGFTGKFNIVYAGNLGAAQGLGAVIQAAAMVQERLRNVQFVFVGDGVEADDLKREAAELGLTNVLFLPRRPATEIVGVLSLADALLIHLLDHPLWGITIPSKTQVSLAAGKPILMAMRGDAADLVARAEAGVLCEPGDPAAIAAAAETLASMPADRLAAMGDSARRFYLEQLALEVGVPRHVQCFENAIAHWRRNR